MTKLDLLETSRPERGRHAAYVPKAPRALLLLIVIVVVFGGAVWGAGAVTNRDPLWFWGTFDAQPVAVCVYREGTAATMLPGDPGYPAMVAAFNSEIMQHVGYYPEFRPVGSSLASYVEQGFAVEAIYAQPVQLHTNYYFPQNVRLLVAIDGSYNYVKFPLLFRGDRAQWLQSAIALASVEQISAAADAALASVPAGNPASAPCMTNVATMQNW